MKRMHETMISALRQANTESDNTPKMLAIAEEMHKKDMAELRDRHTEVVAGLERQIAELRQQNADLDASLKLAVKKQSDLEDSLKAKGETEDAQKKNLETKVRKLEEEKGKLKDAIEMDSQLKANSITQAMDKMREDHARELARVKSESERALQDIKYIHEQEKQSLSDRLEKMGQELRTLQTAKETSASEDMSMQSMQTNYLTEIQELNSHLDVFKKQSYEEIACLKKQRDDAYKKIDSLAPKAKGPQQDRSARGKTSSTANSQLSEDLNKVKKQNLSLKSYVAKLEDSERKLRTQLARYKEYGTTELADTKRILGTDRRNMPGPGDLSRCDSTAIKPSSPLAEDDVELGEPSELGAECETLLEKLKTAQRQRDRALADLERAQAELRTIKTKTARAEERKTEVDQSLKSELKGLISKLAQTKATIAQSMVSPVKGDLAGVMHSGTRATSTFGVQNGGRPDQYTMFARGADRCGSGD